jgi:thioredoxin-dependent peroxiredoxin
MRCIVGQMIETGAPAPDFTLSDQDGQPVTLSALRGRNVVLYFYPKADTPGCTKQACGVRDHAADYEQANAVVLGISKDPVEELRAFADKYGLPFTLLSDEGDAVKLQYGAGKRSTVIVDPEGNVAEVFPSVTPDEHDDLVLGSLRQAIEG